MNESDFVEIMKESRDNCASFDCCKCKLGIPVEVDRFEFPSGKKRTFRYFKCGGLNEAWRYLNMAGEE